MEQDHQFGKQDEKMTIGIRSRSKAFVIHQAFAERRHLIQMSGCKEKMLKETSKKGKKRKVSAGDEGELSMEEWTRYLLDLPELEYTLGCVNDIIDNHRRHEDESIEQE
jgi:hypothetical protein